MKLSIVYLFLTRQNKRYTDKENKKIFSCSIEGNQLVKFHSLFYISALTNVFVIHETFSECGSILTLWN